MSSMINVSLQQVQPVAALTVNQVKAGAGVSAYAVSLAVRGPTVVVQPKNPVVAVPGGPGGAAIQGPPGPAGPAGPEGDPASARLFFTAQAGADETTLTPHPDADQVDHFVQLNNPDTQDDEFDVFIWNPA